jgi:hypothetical protein
MTTLRAGDRVKVRSKEEILQTLDRTGRLEGMPFMPEMLKYCGKEFRVYRRAHKTCDTVSGKYVGRRLSGGIHLDLRCDGQMHGGCQAACLIFWKEAWLEPVNETATSLLPAPSAPPRRNDAPTCTEADVLKATRAGSAGTEPIYSCQATELLEFTTPLGWHDPRQYLEDYTSRNTSLGRIIRSFAFVAYHYGSLAYRGRSGIPARWLYDRLQALYGGVPYPKRKGMIPRQQPTPVVDLNLQAGDLVRVKAYDDILRTIDTDLRNRGLSFDAEMVPYCGRTYRVKSRVERFISERTGRMQTLKTPALILEDVYCRSRYATCRLFCPRSIYAWWREIWLERVCGPE